MDSLIDRFGKDRGPLFQSIHFRLLSLVAAIVAGTVVLLSLYVLRGFVDASVFQLEHEATLLSDTVKASILPALVGEPNFVAIQSQVDRIAEVREKNDIEINILLLDANRTSIVASNIPDNIGTPSIYEHRDTLSALENHQTISFIGRDDQSSNEPVKPPGHPDHYIAPGHRFISVTRPLSSDHDRYGAINTKISLFDIDQRLGKIRRGIILVGVLLPLFAVVLMGFAVSRGLKPLNRIGEEVAAVRAESLARRFDTDRLPTELLPIAERLNELLERLETSFQRERRFTADVAHELRTPIATLKTITQVGLQELGQKQSSLDKPEILEDIFEVTLGMERLVNRLLTLVRCESNQIDIRWEECDLGVMTRETWETFLPLAEERDVLPQLSLNGRANMMTDKILAAGMLTNLISNSVQYSQPEGEIACSVKAEDQSVVFEISNLSNGLNQEDLGHLLEPFWRKDEARSSSVHCGIGLSLVSSYARVMGVEFTVGLSEEGMFTAKLRFPKERPSHTSQPQTSM